MGRTMRGRQPADVLPDRASDAAGSAALIPSDGIRTGEHDMERLTKEGLEQLIAGLAERIGDPRVPRATGDYSLGHTVAHAIRGVEAYLDLVADGSARPAADPSRIQAEELWTTLQRTADVLGQGAQPDSSRPARPRRGLPHQPQPQGGPPAADPPVRATLTAAHTGRILILRPTGELDLGSSGIFQEAALDETSAIVLDLSRTDFCDSMGLNALLRLRSEAKARGIQVHLAAVSPQVTRVLKITQADTIFLIHTGVDEAVAALAHN